jgi:hypothetical protein
MEKKALGRKIHVELGSMKNEGAKPLKIDLNRKKKDNYN